MNGRTEFAGLAEFEAVIWDAMVNVRMAYETNDDTPFDNSHEDVVLRQDEIDPSRKYVEIRGNRVGWIYKSRVDGRYHAFLKTGGVEGERLLDEKKRRDAVFNVIWEAWHVGGRILQGRSYK